MSAHPCGCDPEASWKCQEFPSCTWGRVRQLQELREVVMMSDPYIPATLAPPEMTLNDYQRSLHAYKDRHHECHALGLVGELAEVISELQKDPKWLSMDRDVFLAAGNIADMVKKATAHGVPLDPAKLKKELGDALWYITAVASDNGLTLEDIAKANVAKLQERYPNGFVKGGGVRGPEGSAMNEAQVAALRATESSVNLRAPPASSVSFSCGCSETSIDGVRTRTYCPNGECRRLAR